MIHFASIVRLGCILFVPVVATSQILTFTPPMPKIGDRITITYDEGASGVLHGSEDLKAEVLLMHAKGLPVLVSVPLTKSANACAGSFSLIDTDARFMVVVVASNERRDNNRDNPWSTMVYGEGGIPLENANLVRADFLSGAYVRDFKHIKDFPAALGAVAKEKSLFPDNWRAYPAEWSVLARQSTQPGAGPNLKGSVDAYFGRFGNSDEAITAGLKWLDEVGEHARADSLRAAALRNHPRGLIAHDVRKDSLLEENDPQRRASRIEAFLKEFPLEKAERISIEELLFNTYLQLGQVDNALGVAERTAGSPVIMYNQIAWNWIEKGENLDRALVLAKRALDEAMDPPDSLRPSYISDDLWQESITKNRAMIFDSYGLGLYKLGRIGEAENAFERAYRDMKGESPDFTERLVMTYNKEEKYAEVIDVGTKAIESGIANDSLLEYFKTAYVKVHGSSNGLSELIRSSQEKASEVERARVAKSRISEPAIPFSLKSMDGNVVKLSDLRGKVVVIDFWATWCDPCKKSFPTLEQVYERYSGNNDVRIMALNTWEQVSGKEREDLVKDFMAKNKYRFPVLYDQDAVDDYGVDGIPTRYVIDRKGNIAFVNVGFYNAVQMMGELTAQINLLLAE